MQQPLTRHFKPTLKRAGLAHLVRLYDLRHGCDPLACSERGQELFASVRHRVNTRRLFSRSTVNAASSLIEALDE
jgi:hypothetical protein